MLPEPLQWRILWLLNPKFAVGVSGVVLDEAGRVLLLKHTFRRRYPWGLVSGWVKGNESLEAALLREALEETGLSLSIGHLVTVRKDKYALFLEAVFACQVAGGAFQASNEVSEIQWCDPEALPAGTHPHHAPLIRGLKKSGELPRIASE